MASSQAHELEQSRDLRAIEHALAVKRKHALENAHGLIFLTPPTGDEIPFADHDSSQRAPQDVNTGPFALHYSSPSNSVLLTYQDWLLYAINEADRLSRSGNSLITTQVFTVRTSLESAFAELEDLKGIEWDRQRLRASAEKDAMEIDPNPGPSAPPGVRRIDTSEYLRPLVRAHHPQSLVILLLLAALHLLCGVSIKHSIFVSACLKSLTQPSIAASSVPGGNGFPQLFVPGDVRGALQALHLEPKADQFACCPSCFSLYSMAEQDSIPSHCTRKRMPTGTECGAKLWTTRNIKGRRRRYPCRKFVRQDFHHWLGRLLCRPEMEKIMEDTFRKASRQRRPVDDPASDIWDAPILRELKLSDGRDFMDADTEEGRYAFSICIDGFNPHGKGGPSASVGSIFFACLNLPPDLRYKPENMYLAGIIPGPKHPSRDDLNNILDPILEPFRESYRYGTFYDATPGHPEGKMNHAIVLPLVADTLAAHQMNGNAPHNSHYFCPFCKLTLSEIENVEYDTWEMRTCDDHFAAARAWLHADREPERETTYKATGIRWSALLTLPYWDPIRHVAIDPMHLLYLGLFKHHCESVWGMSSVKDDGLEGITADPGKNKPSPQEMSDARHILRHESLEVLGALPYKVLRELVRELGVDRWHKKKKDKLVAALEQTRIAKCWFTPEGAYIAGDEEHQEEEVLDPRDRKDLDTAMQDLKTKTRAVISRYRQPILARVCSQLYGVPRHQYLRMKKDQLSDIIENYRKLHGIVDKDGLLIDTQAVQAKITEDDSVSDEEYENALKTLKTGTKTALSRLGIHVLVALCKRELDVSLTTKPECLRALHEYRVKNKITDESGKMLIGQTGRDKTEHPIDATELRLADELVGRGSRSSIKKLRPALLIAWCSSRLKQAALQTRKAALDVIDAHRKAEGIVNEKGRVVPALRKKLKNRILGRNTLARIWMDMAKLQAPSWLTRAPPTVGTPGEGSLGADEWRTFCTVHLPITLIAMWGKKDAGSRERLLLDNFMDLVTAIQAASMRVTDHTRRSMYHFHMQRYLRDLLQLFPGTTIVSNQHKALHFTDVLARLGPAHALWCYGFERGNYELQKINTNNRMYDIPETLFRRFCLKQNLRHLFTSNMLPVEIHDLIPSFYRSFGPDNRGTLFNDMSEMAAGDPFDLDILADLEIPGLGHDDLLDTDVETALKEWLMQACGQDSTTYFNPRVKRLSTCLDGGTVYKPQAVSPGDSNIMFTLQDGDTDSWRAGRIRDIFEHIHRPNPASLQPNTGAISAITYVAVDQFVPVDTTVAAKDPYRRYPFIGSLFCSTTTDRPYVIPIDRIMCHFALSKPHIDGMDDSDQYIHVLPLTKW